MDFLEGKKTYVTGILMILIAVGKLVGVEIPGFETTDPGTLLSGAFGLLFLRAGVSKSGPGA